MCVILIYYYTVGLCDTDCLNGGTCTLSGTCKCARGWKGQDCSKGMFAIKYT